MPDNRLELVVEVDTKSGNASIKSFNSSLSEMEREAVRAAQNSAGAMDNFTASVAKGAAAGGLLASVIRDLASRSAELGKSVIMIAADFERARVGMEALTGSAERGKKLFTDIQKFALTSPFEFKDLLVGSNRLLAMGFAADKVLPTLKAISAAGGALGYDSGKVMDLTNALGQVQSSGKITGETLRELRHAAIPVIDILAEKFKMAAGDIQHAIEKQMIPGQLAVQAIVEGLTERFGKFDSAVSKTASVAISNLKDAWQQLADVAGGQLLPQVTEIVKGISSAFGEMGDALKDKPTLLRDVASGMAEVGAVLVAYKLGSLLTGVSIGINAITAALAANPFGLLAAAVVLATAEVYRMNKEVEKNLELSLAAAKKKAVFTGLSEGKTIEQFKQEGISAEDIKGAFSGIKAGELDGPRVAIDGVTGKNATDQYKLASATGAEKAKEIANLQISTERDLAEAQAKNDDYFSTAMRQASAHVRELYEKGSINAGIIANVMKTGYAKALAHARSILRQQVHDGLGEAARDAEALLGDNEYAARGAAFGINSSAVAEYRSETIDRAQRAQTDNAAAVRDSRTRAVDLAEARSLQTTAKEAVRVKLETEQKKLEISIEYLRRVEALEEQSIISRYAKEANGKDRDMRDAIEKRRDEEIGLARQRMNESIAAAQESTLIRQAETMRTAYQNAFNKIEDAAGRLFDAMTGKSKNLWQDLMNLARAAILTPVRQSFTSLMAGILAPMSGAVKMRSAMGSIPFATPPFVPSQNDNGAGVNWTGDPDNGFARYLDTPESSLASAAAAPAAMMITGGGGSVSYAQSVYGAPYGQLGGSGGGFSLGGLFNIGGMKQSLTNLGNWGSKFSLAHGGMTGWKGGALLGGGSMLAMDGLRRGGAIGMLEDIGAGAMIGAKFGGWVGAGIGAAAGALVGGLRWLFGGKSPEQRMKDAVRDAYGVDIDTAYAKSLAQEAGGIDFRVFIQQPQIREQIMLYANMSRQNGASGIARDLVPHGVSLTQSGSQLYQSASYFAGGSYGYQSTLPSLGNFQTVAPAQTTIIQLDRQATTAALGGAAVQSTAQSNGRTSLAANLMSPASVLI